MRDLDLAADGKEDQPQGDLVEHVDVLERFGRNEVDHRRTEDETGQHVARDPGYVHPMGDLASQKAQEDHHPDT